jgi:hypothetical protein
MKKILFLLTTLFLFSPVFAQTSDKITYPCPGTSTRASIQFTRNGDINLVPCPSRNILFNGSATGVGIANLNGLGVNPQFFAVGAADSAVWSSSGSTHTLSLPISSISGSSRSTYLPYFDASNTLAKSQIKYTGTTFDVFPGGAFRFGMDTSGKVVNFGDLTGLDNYISLNDSTGNTNIRVSNRFDIGNYGAEAGAARFDFTLDTFTIQGNTGDFVYSAGGNYLNVEAESGITLNSVDGFTLIGDTVGTANNTTFRVDDPTETITLAANQVRFSNRIAINPINECLVKHQVLDANGELDISANACYLAATNPVVFVTGTTALGAIRHNAGVLTSSLGIADANLRVDYLILDAAAF